MPIWYLLLLLSVINAMPVLIRRRRSCGSLVGVISVLLRCCIQIIRSRQATSQQHRRLFCFSYSILAQKMKRSQMAQREPDIGPAIK